MSSPNLCNEVGKDTEGDRTLACRGPETIRNLQAGFHIFLPAHIFQSTAAETSATQSLSPEPASALA